MTNHNTPTTMFNNATTGIIRSLVSTLNTTPGLDPNVSELITTTNPFPLSILNSTIFIDDSITGRHFNSSSNFSEFNSTRNDFNKNASVPAGNDDDFEGLISDDVLDIIVLIDYVIISGIICFLGIIFNIINAIVFYRLGFEDTINIMLFSLAFTDLGALLPLLWKAVLFNPWFHDWEDLPFDYMTFQYYTGGWPHACFANISCLIIGFVTFDRCLCIAMPLKVRTIITPRRTVIIIAVFYVILVGSLVPLFTTVNFGPVFFEDKNKSIISLIDSSEATFVENITFSFYTFNQLVALVAVILFTAILIVQLKKKSAWRMKMSSARNSISNTTGRDTKIVKLVLLISIVYIICFVPGAVNIVVMIFIPDYSLIGRFKNICTLVWAKSNIFEAFNSTINIFIYMNMSSKYAHAFNKMFGRGGSDGGGGGGGSGSGGVGCSDSGLRGTQSCSIISNGSSRATVRHRLDNSSSPNSKFESETGRCSDPIALTVIDENLNMKTNSSHNIDGGQKE